MCADMLESQQVLDNVEASGRSSAQELLPALKRRNSGKRNLRRPWTSSEEDQLVRLVDHAQYRKQVWVGHTAFELLLLCFCFA